MSYLFTNSLRRCVLSKVNRPPSVVIQQFLKFSTQDGDAKAPEPNDKLGGFAKAYVKHSEAPKTTEPVVENQTFAALLRNSKLIDVSIPVNEGPGAKKYSY